MVNACKVPTKICAACLVFNEDTSKAGICKAIHCALHTQRVSIAGVAISDDGNGRSRLSDVSTSQAKHVIEM